MKWHEALVVLGTLIFIIGWHLYAMLGR